MALDGKLDFDGLLAKFSPIGLKKELLTDLISLLDKSFFLENERFLEVFDKYKRDFASLVVRPAALAGGAYPSDPGELIELVQRNIDAKPPHSLDRKMIGLVSPHIDYHRGHLVYGSAYRQLDLAPECTVILIGTSHKPGESLFQLCNKDFSTPLGHLSADRDFISEFAKLYGPERAFKDEFLHRDEHSLELQLPFLYSRAPQVKIVPILVGSFYEFLRNDTTPDASAEYTDFIETLRFLVAKWQTTRQVFFILGIDLAHQGRQFGDSFELTDLVTQETERRDFEYLNRLECADKSGLWSHVAEDMDKRRICGFPTTYTVMDTLDRLGLEYQTQIFDYRQAINSPAGCMVTFAAAGLVANNP
jgi:AmmeMemoRadiSam system protein B